MTLRIKKKKGKGRDSTEEWTLRGQITVKQIYREKMATQTHLWIK